MSGNPEKLGEQRDDDDDVKRARLSFPNVLVELCQQSRAVQALMTLLRDQKTPTHDFVRYSQRLCRLLVEEALASAPGLVNESHTVTTPTQRPHCGLHVDYNNNNSMAAVVSIVRSGDIIADAFKELLPGLPVGKMLVQRQEHTADKASTVHWCKLPSTITSCQQVFVVDPMLATGGSAENCLRILIDEQGVAEHSIVFVNVLCCPEGLDRLAQRFPKVKVVTCCIDRDGLNEHKYICPGLGDYGDRYYSTT